MCHSRFGSIWSDPKILQVYPIRPIKFPDQVWVWCLLVWIISTWTKPDPFARSNYISALHRVEGPGCYFVTIPMLLFLYESLFIFAFVQQDEYFFHRRGEASTLGKVFPTYSGLESLVWLSIITVGRRIYNSRRRKLQYVLIIYFHLGDFSSMTKYEE